ncbi:hypothetical protein ACFL0F_02320 [Patescibacteria group bacterium]
MSQEMNKLLDVLGSESIEPSESQTEEKEYLNWTHSKLIGEAWEKINSELKEKGNTSELLTLRRDYSKKLLEYWLNKGRLYMSEEGSSSEVWKNIDGGDIKIIVGEDYNDEDTKIVIIERRTPLEHDEVTLSVVVTPYSDGGYCFELEEYMRPPKIRSEIKTDPDEFEDLIYEVIFRGNKISTFSRQKIYEDKNNERPYIKRYETIDCSIFGVDL